MKKLITITIAMMLLLTACGAGAAGNKVDKNIEGEWTSHSGSTLVTIEGDTVLVERYGSAYAGSVDRNAKTITIKDGQQDGSFNTIGDAVFQYQIIKDKLVLTADNEDTFLGWDKTFSFAKQDTEGSEK